MKPITLMSRVYRKILPAVHQELAYWRSRAEKIPNLELRNQALASIEHKTFHCEGGAILALTAGVDYKKAVKFIVAYQTISDYLDNLCDRSTSLDPDDFAALHKSMTDALVLHADQRNYYRLRTDQDDAGYLQDLSETCRSVLREIKHYPLIKDYLLELCQYYCDLQIHKHVAKEQRVPRLEKWFHHYQEELPEMEWYEFSACSGSTLGIFCLISYAMRDDFRASDADNIRKGYFPYIQGLHILLDYFIDQEEDIAGGDLNFCSFYKSEETLFQRLKHFLTEADKHTEFLPHKNFHQLINRGLLGIYLSDGKVRKQKNVRRLARGIIKSGGWISYFFYFNGLAYRSFQKSVPAFLTRILAK
ncbi:tetraprenyl-beta-curcumene synthase family protein [Neobacillus sp. MM2021_6]|uniref:tetraprenyl-beta-curcumene synthase family protein n=1 Tax=Bacillaceae TaxID=186817 RepID=UPI00140E6247|nr:MULTISPECIES: tetraprenyl-beta-curcumene synthase family protein [Bacillaceae]MBO0960307.1 tetraprenyl-beta-curcumene synthase family protein [Neobacillus sp. MM2021_6]NHC17417.1 tetraprenyl-beta-curcumene synthase family protein [Bacillus sp. MM2020_4]